MLVLCLKTNSSEHKPRILVHRHMFVLLKRALVRRMDVRLSLKLNFR